MLINREKSPCKINLHPRIGGLKQLFLFPCDHQAVFLLRVLLSGHWGGWKVQNSLTHVVARGSWLLRTQLQVSAAGSAFLLQGLSAELLELPDNMVAAFQGGASQEARAQAAALLSPSL